MGTAGSHGLQGTSLAQLLCHMVHIEEARELGYKMELMRARKGRQDGGKGSLVRRTRLTFPGLGLRHWMTWTWLL